jgi:hypothetical protein
LFIISRASSSLQETTFSIFVTVCSLSPGFILSGEYQSLKSFQYVNQEIFSIIGRQISSVTPGKTVDS